MTKHKVFVVEWPGSGHQSVERMFINKGWDVVNDLEDADLVQFCGGNDVDPSYYKQNPHPTTFPDAKRDEKEAYIFERAQELGIPCAGICRGGQFLHVMNGGELWQDVNNHMGPHNVSMYSRLIPILVSSDHHQMMSLTYETKDRAIILMYANEATTKTKMSEVLKGGANPYEIRRYIKAHGTDEDLEAIYYPDTNCLCFQPHPEYAGFKDCETAYFHFLDNYTFDDEKAVNAEDVCAFCDKLGDYCDC